MKRLFLLTVSILASVTLSALQPDALEQLKSDPRKAYGNDYPYPTPSQRLTKAPKGYKAFYISHYGRHGSRYFWNDSLYPYIDSLLRTAEENGILTAEGRAFRDKFMEVERELNIGMGELTQLGWEQHQGIAARMYGNFPDVFRKGGNVNAVSSLSVRCMISMSAFCQELVQCNPELEIREEASRFTMNRVVPADKKNPEYRHFDEPEPKFKQSGKKLPWEKEVDSRILARIFTDPGKLPMERGKAVNKLKELYRSLPNIGREGMMGGIVTDEDMVANWENSNLSSFRYVFSRHLLVIPILEDILLQAQSVIDGRSADVASLRFGHDSYVGPLSVLMGLDGADGDPEDPAEVKNVYRNWDTCMASNIQIVFYRKGRDSSDILVKFLLNENEVTVPLKTDIFPYYRWEDVREFYNGRCSQGR